MKLHLIRNELTSGKSIYDLKLKVTFYARVSTESDNQLNSLNNQTSFFKEFINSNSNWEYVEGYVDEGISGTSDNRPSFLRMISDSGKGLFDLIITKEISRFSRNTLDSIKYTRYLLLKGVCVYFLSDNINTIYTDSELRLTIMSSLAQDEVRRISERVKFGMKRSIKNGQILGNDRLYGYRKNKNTGNLRIISKEKEVIRKIYELYVYEDYSLTKIVKYLNELNIKTSMNNDFSVTSLKRIITNPKYKGYYCAHKTEVSDFISKKVIYYDKSDWIMYKDYKKIPPIVNEELWNKANLKIEQLCNKKYKKSKSLYSGLIYCGYDNSLFYKRNKIWYCSNYLKNGKNKCKNVSIFESELTIIINYINEILNINYKEIKDYLINLYKDKNLEKYIDEIIKENVIIFLVKKIEVFKGENFIKLVIHLKKNIEHVYKEFLFEKNLHFYKVSYV